VNDIDVTLDILKAMVKAHPDSVFVNSLYQQYCNRGGLSKKQLEGLHSKASKTETISFAKLATLEAIIKRKPTRERSSATITTSENVKDEETGKLITSLLEKYPLHKRVLFLKNKLDGTRYLTPAETAEVQKFAKLLL
jgi:hypothetical protein